MLKRKRWMFQERDYSDIPIPAPTGEKGVNFTSFTSLSKTSRLLVPL
jgi:hypothetical protein